MNDFTTVFEISGGANGIRADTLFRLAIGLFGIAAGIAGIIKRQRNQGQWPRKLFTPICMICWGTIWLVFHIPLVQISTTKINSLLEIDRSGASDVVEGVVEVRHEQPASGHSRGDVITIGGKEFEINYFLVTPGYKTTISHGGVLRQGVYARLHYHDGIILKVETKAGPPAAAVNGHPRLRMGGCG